MWAKIFCDLLKIFELKESKKKCKNEVSGDYVLLYYEISCFRKLLAGLLIDVGYKKFAKALFAIEKR